jgi:hypothetical protein
MCKFSSSCRHSLMSKHLVLLSSIALAACAGGQVTDVGSPYYVIPEGSMLIINKELSVPPGSAHVDFQDGAMVPSTGKYQPSCSLMVNSKLSDTPQPIMPDDIRITRSTMQEASVSEPTITNFIRILYLQSEKQPQITLLTCHQRDGPVRGMPVTVEQIRQALGNYITLKLGP